MLFKLVLKRTSLIIVVLLSVPTPIPGLLGPAPPAVFILPITHLKGATQPGLKSYIVSGCQSLSKASYPHHLLERVKRYGFPIGCWEGAPLVSGGVSSNLHSLLVSGRG